MNTLRKAFLSSALWASLWLLSSASAQTTPVLIVRQAFSTYHVGDVISDPAAIAAIQASPTYSTFVTPSTSGQTQSTSNQGSVATLPVLHGEANQPTGYVSQDGNGTIGNQTVFPTGGTVPQTLSSLLAKSVSYEYTVNSTTLHNQTLPVATIALLSDFGGPSCEVFGTGIIGGEGGTTVYAHFSMVSNGQNGLTVVPDLLPAPIGAYGSDTYGAFAPILSAAFAGVVPGLPVRVIISVSFNSPSAGSALTFIVRCTGASNYTVTH